MIITIEEEQGLWPNQPTTTCYYVIITIISFPEFLPQHGSSNNDWSCTRRLATQCYLNYGVYMKLFELYMTKPGDCSGHTIRANIKPADIVPC